jgi:hypothetical protein
VEDWHSKESRHIREWRDGSAGDGMRFHYILFFTVMVSVLSCARITLLLLLM